MAIGHGFAGSFVFAFGRGDDRPDPGDESAVKKLPALNRGEICSSIIRLQSASGSMPSNP
jgi:hypothetical protein